MSTRKNDMDKPNDNTLRQEIEGAEHPAPSTPATSPFMDMARQIYSPNDFVMFQNMDPPVSSYYRTLKSLDELLDRDSRREEDGFKRKIRVAKVVKPSHDGSKKVVVVPTTTEEKFYHDSRNPDEEDGKKQKSGQDGEGQETGDATGTAEGEEGDVIGERPLHGEGEGEGEGYGAGQGEGEDHEIGASAYDLGKILTEKFQLPNLKDKGKKKSFTKYVYDLTDRNRGEGQVLDKKRSLIEILKTNIALDNFDPDKPLDPSKLIITPRDYIYQTLSSEPDVESQAVVFFVRDYSGSMYGKPTEIVCSQHVMIYSWLMYQYREQVETRFVLHDTEAKEVEDFHTYNSLNVAGGTKIQSAFAMVNDIVVNENLAADYNIYVFYGGDGDDWNHDEKLFVETLEQTLTFTNRIGITIVARTQSYSSGDTEFQRFLKKYEIIEKNKKLVSLDVIPEDADDRRLIDGIKTLVTEKTT